MKHVSLAHDEPLRQEIPYADAWSHARRLRGRKGLLFLDSAMQQGELGRYSYAACDPFQTFVPLAGESGAATLARLAAALASYRLRAVDDLPPFQGGYAGFIAYEFGAALEPGLAKTMPKGRLPGMMFHAYDTVVAFDHAAHRAWIVATGFPETAEPARMARARARALEMGAHLEAALPPFTGDHVIRGWQSNFSRPQYEAAVARTIEYILAGDIFQANISQRFAADIPAGFDPYAFHARLRATNPATFGAFLDFGEVQIASSSPERLLRYDGEAAEARPIKGTVRRDADPHADAALMAELLASRKDRAENVMIVDLLRNDLSRVCEPGSVRVPVLCGLESYASVHHLVSVVTGRPSPGLGLSDLIGACFPGGSITGAPKYRAMEIIAGIEGSPRDIYCGSIGYLGFNGMMDLNIAIRTVLFHEDRAVFQGGGGITARSDPAAEYEETLAKVSRIMAAFAP
ncbi:aminodeoxychorismate synthase component I [soil metagenome]